MVGVQYISTKDVSGVGSYSYQVIHAPVYTLILNLKKNSIMRHCNAVVTLCIVL